MAEQKRDYYEVLGVNVEVLLLTNRLHREIVKRQIEGIAETEGVVSGRIQSLCTKICSFFRVWKRNYLKSKL